MNVLVLSAAYPTLNGSRPMYFVHSRNLYYKEKGINVTVLNFSTDKGYVYENIQVISLNEFKKNNLNYDLLILHAANLRNHYKFIMNYGKEFEKKIFIFHGHEVLHINKYYPKPYPYEKKNNLINKFKQNIYDELKLKIWHMYYKKNVKNIRLVFVSNWIFKQFKDEVHLNDAELENHAVVISNSIGKYFENNKYSPNNLKYDYLTIRSNLDDSKYAIDIVVNLARKYPQYLFCIIGKGKYFSYNSKPENICWIQEEMTHEDLMKYINQSKCALLPTREDTQGLMACELAACGIPLITSNIEVCREIFSDCLNVSFIDNNNPILEQTSKNMLAVEKEWKRFYAENTILKEIEFIYKYVGEK